MEMTLDTAFLIRFLINSSATLILVRFCYYAYSHDRSYAASYILFGMGVFFVTASLHSADISMGFAFGLFAVFSMLRYRTESITIKEMTYLFLVIAIALLSAVAPLNPFEIAALNAIICLIAWIMETNLFLPILQERNIEYENIENTTPERYSVLLAELKQRTGLDIRRVEIMSLDYLRDTTKLKIHFVPPILDADFEEGLQSVTSP